MEMDKSIVRISLHFTTHGLNRGLWKRNFDTITVSTVYIKHHNEMDKSIVCISLHFTAHGLNRGLGKKNSNKTVSTVYIK